MKPWREVIQSDQYLAWTPEQQSGAQQQYFDEVVRPKLDPTTHEDAWTQFTTQYPLASVPGVSSPSVSSPVPDGLGAGALSPQVDPDTLIVGSATVGERAALLDVHRRHGTGSVDESLNIALTELGMQGHEQFEPQVKLEALRARVSDFNAAVAESSGQPMQPQPGGTGELSGAQLSENPNRPPTNERRSPFPGSVPTTSVMYRSGMPKSSPARPVERTYPDGEIEPVDIPAALREPGALNALLESDPGIAESIGIRVLRGLAESPSGHLAGGLPKIDIPGIGKVDLAALAAGPSKEGMAYDVAQGVGSISDPISLAAFRTGGLAAKGIKGTSRLAGAARTAVGGGVGIGLHGGIAEATRQFEAGDIDLAKIGVETAKSTATGVALGPAGFLKNPYTKFLAESLIFGTVPAVEEQRVPTVDDYVHSLAFLGVLKATHGLPEAAARGLSKFAKNRTAAEQAAVDAISKERMDKIREEAREVVDMELRDGEWVEPTAKPKLLKSAMKLQEQQEAREKKEGKPAKDKPLDVEPVAPEAPAVEAGVKEPWQMTREELDASGNILFHGTTSAKAIQGGGFKKGWTHLADSREVADSYQGWVRGDSPSTLRVSFRPKNPAFFDAKGKRYTDHDANLGYHINQAAYEAEKAGHDALIIRNIRDHYDSSVPTEPHTSVIAFDQSKLGLIDHRKAVQQALASGKPVPPEVLKDYPDLAKPAKKKIPLKRVKKPNAGQLKAVAKVDQALKAGDTTEGVAKLAKDLILKDPTFNETTSLDISQAVFEVSRSEMARRGLIDPGVSYEIAGQTSIFSEYSSNNQRTAIALYRGHAPDTIVHEFSHDYWFRLTRGEQQVYIDWAKETGRAVDEADIAEDFAEVSTGLFFSEKLHETSGSIRELFKGHREILLELIQYIRRIRGEKIPARIKKLAMKAGLRKPMLKRKGPLKEGYVEDLVQTDFRDATTTAARTAVKLAPSEKGNLRFALEELGRVSEGQFDSDVVHADQVFMHGVDTQGVGGIRKLGEVHADEIGTAIDDYHRQGRRAPADFYRAVGLIGGKDGFTIRGWGAKFDKDPTLKLSPDAKLEKEGSLEWLGRRYHELAPEYRDLWKREELTDYDWPDGLVVTEHSPAQVFAIAEKVLAGKALGRKEMRSYLKLAEWSEDKAQQEEMRAAERGPVEEVEAGKLEEVDDDFDMPFQAREKRSLFQTRRKLEQDKLGFYSPADKALGEMQLGKIEHGPSLWNRLKKRPGVVAEAKWTGLDDFLAGKKKVTPEEVRQYLAENRVEIEEVRLGRGTKHKFGTPEEQDAANLRYETARDRFRDIPTGDPGEQAAMHEFRDAETAMRDVIPGWGLGPDSYDGATKFADYSTPGGENYREILLRKPVAPSLSFEEFKRQYNKRFPGQNVTNEDLRDERLRGYWADGKTVPDSGQLTSRDESYSGGHFDQTNVIAHLRVQDFTTADGKKALLVEESQSDWARDAREKGIRGEVGIAGRKQLLDKLKAVAVENGMSEQQADRDITDLVIQPLDTPERSTADQWQRLSDATEGSGIDLNEVFHDMRPDNDYSVPDAPFIRGGKYQELNMKRALRMAAEEGYDELAWVTGEQTADRYDLSKKISEVHYSGTNFKAYDLDGYAVITETGVRAEDIPGLIGKEAADRLLKQPGPVQSLEGEELRVGGEWAFNLYDKAIPKILQKIGKKWGVKAGKSELDVTREMSAEDLAEHDMEVTDSKIVHSIPITPEMRGEITTEGLSLFQTRKRETPVETVARIEREPIQIDPETRFNRERRRFQNTLQRLDTMEALGKKELGPGAPTPGQTGERYVGRAGHRIEKMSDEVFDKVKAAKKAGYSLADLSEYMQASHAAERNKHNDWDGASGMTNAEASKILAKWKETDIASHADPLQEMSAGTLDILEKGGIITPELRVKLEEQYDYYVPFGRDFSPEENRRQVAGKGFSVAGTGIKRSKGSKRAVLDITTQILTARSMAIDRVEKNKVSLELASLVEQMPSNIWHIEPQKSVFHFNDAGELVLHGKLEQPKDHVVDYFQDGKPMRIVLDPKEKGLVNAMKNLGVEKTIPVLREMNNYFRYTATTANLEFLLTNPMRDIQEAMIHVTADHGPKMAAKVLKDIPLMAFSVGVDKLGKSDGLGHWAKDMAAHGGKVSWVDKGGDIDVQVEQMRKKLARLGKPSPGNAVRKLGEALEFMGAIAEMPVRVSTYKNLVEAGIPKPEAALYAKNVTINFNKKGELGGILGSAYLFFNAGVQGPARQARMFKRAPKAATALVSMIIAQGFLEAMMNYWLNDEEYSKLEARDKDNYWVVMKPGSDERYTMRVPYGYNVAKTFGNVLYEQVTGRSDKAEAASRMLGSLMDGFIPINGHTLSQFLSPTPTDPVIQLGENKQWHGGPIKPDQPQFGAKIPESQLYFKSVRPMSKRIAEGLNVATGGTRPTDTSKGLSGWMDVSPEVLDFTLDTFGGGAGKLLGRSAATIEHLIKGERVPLNTRPLLRQFHQETRDSWMLPDLYHMRDESARRVYSESETAKFMRLVDEAVKAEYITKKQAGRYKSDFKNNQRKASGKPKPIMFKRRR